MWRKRSSKEAAKKAKQRLKRAQAKLKQQEKAPNTDAEEKAAAAGTLSASDTWDSFAVYRADGPVRGFDFLPNVKPEKAVCRLTVVLANNIIEFIHVLKVCKLKFRSSERRVPYVHDTDIALEC